jgi:dUTP pyrophosphatase
VAVVVVVAAVRAAIVAIVPDADHRESTKMSERPALKVFRLSGSGAALPGYATSGAAGLDLSAALGAPIALAPGQRVAIPTGLIVALPPGHEGQVRPRSGLALRRGLTVANAPGTIDEDYRGELQVLLVNLSHEVQEIAPGDRIAQLVVAPITHVAVVEVEDEQALGATTRGSGGFGSTGG